MAEPVQEKDEVKQRAIKRLLVAVVLVIVAVGILTYLSYYKPSKVVTKPTPETLPPPPPPIVTGPEPQIVQPAPPAPTLPELPPPADAPAPQAAPTPTPLPPPPPPTVSSKPLPQPGPGPQKTPAGVQKPVAQKPAEQKPLVPAQNAQPPAPTPAPSKPAAAAQGYVVQFGVFSNPQNALQLVEKLRQAGIEAQTETHVQLPPFKTRAEADAALAKMREKGLTATVVAR